jgi:hypothetical protein
MSPEPGSHPVERRAHPRRPASGDVSLRPEGLMSEPLHGRLVDVAQSGFRARHDCQGLVAGQIVEFRFKALQGRARVMWTRILHGHVESGFFILPRE